MSDAVQQAREQAQFLRGHMMPSTATLLDELAAAVETLTEALLRARTDIANVAQAGFDSTRDDIALAALYRIDSALAAVEASAETPRIHTTITTGGIMTLPLPADCPGEAACPRSECRAGGCVREREAR